MWGWVVVVSACCLAFGAAHAAAQVREKDADSQPEENNASEKEILH